MESNGPAEWDINIETDMKPYISDQDLDYVMGKNNKQTAMLYLQSHHLRILKKIAKI
jgi:putative membrane protein